MKIAFGYDHAGFAIREYIIDFLMANGHQVIVFGKDSDEPVDYSDIAIETAEYVRDKNADCGILVCGTGIGMSIAANKVKGIRCALCSEPLSARLTREHNNTNMLALGERTVGIELIIATIATWLNTDFSNNQRHINRIEKISKYENK